MYIFPAIDLCGGQVVRLYKGDYSKKTVYSDDPATYATDFYKAGAEYLHLVDLDGAKEGRAVNLPLIENLIRQSQLKVEVGGGIRTEDTIRQYIDIGVFRVILGTAALQDRPFLIRMVEKYGDKIAVGVDIRDGMVATHGWTETSTVSCLDFCHFLEEIGVSGIICTDISKDGAMAGTNLELYKTLHKELHMGITASGGVSSLSDVRALAKEGVYGAILGKALYTGDVKLEDAILASRMEK